MSVGDGQPQPIEVGGGNRGRPLDLGSVAGTVQLFGRPMAAPGASSAVAPVRLGEVAWPAGAPKKVLLVLASPQGSNASVRAVALVDDESAFPVHTVRIVNFTGAPVLTRFGQTVKKVAPGASEPMPYTVVGDPKAKDAPQFPFAFATGETVFYNGKITAWPQSRTLVLVAPPVAGGKPPLVQTLFDRLPPAKTSEKS